MDGGLTWSRTGLATTGFVRALAIDPSDPNTLYAGTTGGVFKSTNGGANWSAANNGLTNLNAHIGIECASRFSATGA